MKCEHDALFALAKTEQEQDHFGEARDYYETVLALTESSRAKLLRQELRATYLASRQDEYEMYVDLLMQMSKQQPNAGYAAAALQINERSRARSLLETLAEARADIRQGIAAGLLAEERKLSEQIRGKGHDRAGLIGDPHGAEKAELLEKEISDLLDEYQALQARIRASSPRYAALTQPQPAAVEEIQKQCLDEQTVLLQFALGEYQSWLWAITPDAITSYALPPRAQIEASARKIYDLLTARQVKVKESDAEREVRIAAADARFKEEAGMLSRILLGAIADKLRGEWKTRRLLIVAGDALEYLPFGILPLPPSETNQLSGSAVPLIVDHEIVNLPSASALLAIRRETAGRQHAAKMIAVLADPVFEADDPRVLRQKKGRAGQKAAVSTRSASDSQAFSADLADSPLLQSLRSMGDSSSPKDASRRWRYAFSRLPFSRDEASAIVSLVPARSVLKATDFQASHAEAIGGALSDYRILHFATHGLLNSNHPELSGIVLSLVDKNGRSQDGFLRMHEIYNLRIPADLVVLSACQTALGKEVRGEGLIGLTRGFMYAGAERVVASLWQVDDLATAELMKRFYSSMLKDGIRPQAALRAAQLEMMEQKRWSAPYFWAAFVMQGEWK